MDSIVDLSMCFRLLYMLGFETNRDEDSVVQGKLRNYYPMAQRKRINLKELPLYESQLLNAIAFFQGRPYATQAYNALTFYVRQSESRVMKQVGFYARRLKMDEWELLELIYQDEEKAKELIEKATEVDLIERSEPDEFDDPG